MKNARLIWLAFLTVIVIGAILILTTAKALPGARRLEWLPIPLFVLRRS